MNSAPLFAVIMRGLGASVLLVVALAACSDGRQSRAPTPMTGPAPGFTGIRFLADGNAGGYERADTPRDFVFPRDHGGHPKFRTEWWYFTGNLFGDKGRHYGFELTFFRVGLNPDPAPRESAWASNEIWMANFAVTDTANGQFFAAERLSRGALELAGAEAPPIKVWVEDWSVAQVNDGSLQLRAQDGEIELSLELRGLDQIVTHGDAGLDQKGPEPGNASYYYSVPRIAATGSIRTGPNAPDTIAGDVWMDREWSTSALSEGLAGWDWFALQLDDGSDLMFYRLRQADGEMSPFSTGTVTRRDGRSEPLAASDVELEVVRYWQSPTTTTVYPIAWHMNIPRLALALDIEPVLSNQEINLTVRYWEGAVRISGQSGDSAIAGNGYLELAGY